MENFKIIQLNTANLWAFWSPRDICFKPFGPHGMEEKMWHKPEGDYRTQHPSVLLLATAPGDQHPFAISHVCSPSPAPTDIQEALNKSPEEKAGKPSYRWCIPNDLEVLMRTRTRPRVRGHTWAHHLRRYQPQMLALHIYILMIQDPFKWLELNTWLVSSLARVYSILDFLFFWELSLACHA